MNWDHRSLPRLRDILAELYPTRQDSVRVVSDAGLDSGRIAFDNQAILNWFVILQEAERAEAIDTLVEVVSREYPEKLEALKGGSEDGDDTPIAGEAVSTGLAALSDMMAQPEVRDAVVAFRIRFEDASEQIEVVANYKDLHDRLHELQFQCYDRIVQEARSFPDDEFAGENLAEHERDLNDLIEDLGEVAKRGSIQGAEVRWIEESLIPASTSLREALDEKSAAKLTRAARLIDRVLAVQPSLINTRLNDGARALRLPDLIQTLKVVLEKIDHSATDPEKVRQFSEGVVILVKLHDNLSALVSDHDGWQRVDEELRRIAAGIVHDVGELELSWPDVEGWLEPLCEASPKSWYERFRSDLESVSSALLAKDAAKIRRAFRLVRRGMGKRFYRVDLSLKRQCDELRKVGAPLASVLEMVQ